MGRNTLPLLVVISILTRRADPINFFVVSLSSKGEVAPVAVGREGRAFVKPPPGRSTQLAGAFRLRMR